MNDTQLENFIYCCLSFASNAHFDDERYIKNILGKPLSEKTFLDTIMENYKIANNMHFGVCFTMTCWAYHLLYTMGIDSGYYLLETIEKDTGYPNYVLLYEYNGEYHICDLTLQVIRCEEAIKELFHISRYPDQYSEEDKQKALAILSDSKYICCSLEEYAKEYNLGFVVLAEGIDDKRIFTDIPEMFIGEFLKNQSSKRG
ncbi:MAG: hypothetical protein K2J20_06810 [Bacilli bacterium]|nr:hypothetical protein [Bacilli bacterium]